MVNVLDLRKTTNKFFNELCRNDVSKPTWSDNWYFKDTLPHNDKKGCYAHLNGNEVVYIGLAIGNSFDGSGIGARVSNYWKKSENYSSTNQFLLIPPLGLLIGLADGLAVGLVVSLAAGRELGVLGLVEGLVLGCVLGLIAG